MASHLAAPPDRLDGFPERMLPAGTSLWLVHPEGRPPWLCSAGTGARFNLDAPLGTCHLALDPLGALVESCCRDEPSIDAETAAAHRLSRLVTDRQLRVADLADARAYGFGVTAEIHSTPEYEATRAWARAAHAAGFDGLRYLVRHDPSQRLEAVALFGPEGECADWPAPQTEAVPTALLDEAAQRLGVAVEPAAWEAAG